MADILIAIGQGLLNAAKLGSITPASLVVLAAVEGQRRGQCDPEVVADLDGEELLVDVELHAGLAIGGGAVETVDAVVLGIADPLDLEVVLEELGVGSEGGHCEFLVLVCRWIEVGILDARLKVNFCRESSSFQSVGKRVVADGIESVLGNFQMEMRLRDGDAAMQLPSQKIPASRQLDQDAGASSGAATIGNPCRVLCVTKVQRGSQALQ